MDLDKIEKKIDELSLEELLDALEETNANMLPYLRRLRQGKAFRARIIKMDAEKDQMIRDMAWLAYGDQVLDTGMKEHLIGGDNEYADADDWIDSYIEGLRHE